MQYTKRTARELLRTNDYGLARFFGITTGAVSQWPEDVPLPPSRQMILELASRSKRDLRLDADWRSRPVKGQGRVKA